MTIGCYSGEIYIAYQHFEVCTVTNYHANRNLVIPPDHSKMKNKGESDYRYRMWSLCC